MIKTHLRYTSNFIVYRFRHVPALGRKREDAVQQAAESLKAEVNEGRYGHHRLLKISALYQGRTLVGP
jgi:hypothetical protein